MADRIYEYVASECLKVKELSDSEFDTIKTSLIQTYKKEFQNINEEFDHFYNLYSSDLFVDDFKARMITNLEETTKE